MRRVIGDCRTARRGSAGTARLVHSKGSMSCGGVLFLESSGCLPSRSARSQGAGTLIQRFSILRGAA